MGLEIGDWGLKFGIGTWIWDLNSDLVLRLEIGVGDWDGEMGNRIGD